MSLTPIKNTFPVDYSVLSLYNLKLLTRNKFIYIQHDDSEYISNLVYYLLSDFEKFGTTAFINFSSGIEFKYVFDDLLLVEVDELVLFKSVLHTVLFDSCIFNIIVYIPRLENLAKYVNHVIRIANETAFLKYKMNLILITNEQKSNIYKTSDNFQLTRRSNLLKLKNSKSGQFCTFLIEDESLSFEYSLIDTALSTNVITRNRNWFIYNDIQYNGLKNLMTKIKNDEYLKNSILFDINHLCFSQT